MFEVVEGPILRKVTPGETESLRHCGLLVLYCFQLAALLRGHKVPKVARPMSTPQPKGRVSFESLETRALSTVGIVLYARDAPSSRAAHNCMLCARWVTTAWVNSRHVKEPWYARTVGCSSHEDSAVQCLPARHSRSITMLDTRSAP